MKLQDLPQGPLPGKEPLPELEETPQETGYPTTIQQARNNMRRFSKCVLLTRVGGFYELYFESAEEIGPLLGLKVARKKTHGGPVAMSGFPFFQLDRFLKALVQDHGKYVAISEEYPNPEKGGLMFDRRVSRIITPGTLIDEKFMDPYENNYLLAIVEPSEGGGDGDTMGVGLAWLDLSTGNFFTQESEMGSLRGDVARIGPREVVLAEGPRSAGVELLIDVFKREQYCLTFHSPTPAAKSGVASWADMLETRVEKRTAAGMSEMEVRAGDLLLSYAKARLPGMPMKLQPPVRKSLEDDLLIDASSMRALEIKKTLRERTAKGSLLHTINRTVTKSGARLLSNWLSMLCPPSFLVSS